MSKLQPTPVNADPAVLLKAEGITLALQEKYILKDIFFNLHKAEILSLIGSNGAGKTTLARIISGLISGWSGDIIFSGKNLRSLKQRQLAKLICYVPQVTETLPYFRVFDFIKMARYAHEQSAENHIINAALEMAGIAHLAERTLPTLSGGERQMAFIAAGLAQEAELLILDEPTAFLDPPRQEELMRLVKKINRQKELAFIIITHDLNNAIFHSNRIIALKQGGMVFDGSPENITKGDNLLNIYGMNFSLAAHPANGRKFIVPDCCEK